MVPPFGLIHLSPQISPPRAVCLEIPLLKSLTFTIKGWTQRVLPKGRVFDRREVAWRQRPMSTVHRPRVATACAVYINPIQALRTRLQTIVTVYEDPVWVKGHAARTGSSCCRQSRTSTMPVTVWKCEEVHEPFRATLADPHRLYFVPINKSMTDVECRLAKPPLDANSGGGRDCRTENQETAQSELIPKNPLGNWWDPLTQYAARSVQFDAPRTARS